MSDPVLEKAYENILNEIIDEITLQFCFSCHRNIKQNCELTNFFYVPYDENEEEAIGDGTAKETIDVFGQNVDRIVFNQVKCPKCHRLENPKQLGSHLSRCMGYGRNGSQKCYADFLASDCEEGDLSNPEPRQVKKRKNVKAKIPRSRTVAASAFPFDPSSEFSNWTYEDKFAFFNRACGVRSSKSRNKMCLHKPNCKTHTEDEKKNIRLLELNLSSVPSSSQDTVEDIDVATVNDGNSCLQYWSISSSPSAPENCPLSCKITTINLNNTEAK